MQRRGVLEAAPGSRGGGQVDGSPGASVGPEGLAEAFAELVETTVGEFDVYELLQVLVDRAVEVLNVAAAGLMLADGKGDLQMMVATDDAAKFLELFQIQHDEGPCLEAYRGGKTVLTEAIADGLDRWPRFGSACLEAGFSSVMAVPMHVDGKVVGALNLFGSKEQPPASSATATIAEAMAKVAAIAIENDRVSRERATLIMQLETALETRVVIEQAKGILATHFDIPLNDAFGRLRERARSSRRLLRDVAEEVVKTRGDDYASIGD